MHRESVIQQMWQMLKLVTLSEGYIGTQCISHATILKQCFQTKNLRKKIGLDQWHEVKR